MEIRKRILISEEKEVGGRNKVRIKGNQHTDDIFVKEEGIRNHPLNKDGMGFTAVFTDNSCNDDLTIMIKDTDSSRIGCVKSPGMMGTGRAANGIKIYRIDNFIISCLIILDFFRIFYYYHNVLNGRIEIKLWSGRFLSFFYLSK